MRSLKIFFAATLVWLEVGCGLPSPYFLAAPIPGTLAVGTTSTASFTNPGTLAGNQTTLAGFEVYYKFSASTPTGNDINLGGGGTPGPGTLQADGFFPMCLSGDTPPISRTAPMISVSGADAASSFTVTLTINPIAILHVQLYLPHSGAVNLHYREIYLVCFNATLTSRWFAQNALLPPFCQRSFDYAGPATLTRLSTIPASGPRHPVYHSVCADVRIRGGNFYCAVFNCDVSRVCSDKRISLMKGIF